MPDDPWQKARDQDAVRRAQQPDCETASDYATLVRIAQNEREMKERVRRVRELNRVWALIKKAEQEAAESNRLDENSDESSNASSDA